ncbi:patr class I histocompatibility antigen, A-108 alpha chain-like [Astyanax mexicanus]|uniref:patr class I histocompatibility antigen, A-108 alpha chain-like n=1 Tax=Astyanax mexicanus TaxID=7994 RepID=UPI0020CAEEAE|nr:patr class I histocompatibility antigen, A-108 alpha chain-like [Astyanax mexicanus]
MRDMEERTEVLRLLFFLAVSLHLSSAGSHSLQYSYTVVSPGTNLPEFTAVGQLDGEQIVYYDSNISEIIPKTEWIKNVDDYAEYWNEETTRLQCDQQRAIDDLTRAVQFSDHTEGAGVHTFQSVYGCEKDDDGTERGYKRNSFDGDDYISLDLNTETYNAVVPEAVPNKWMLERADTVRNQKAYLLNECIELLQKYVKYGRSTLERKVAPEVSLFQKNSSSPVVCHATGFFPKAVNISWQKNGEELNEDVELRETLPNQDGTFQKRSILTVSPEELKNNQYTCVVQHSSLEKVLVLQVSDHKVLSAGVAGGDGVSVGVIIGVVVAVLLLVFIAYVFFIWKKKKSGFKPVSEVPRTSSADLLNLFENSITE